MYCIEKQYCQWKKQHHKMNKQNNLELSYQTEVQFKNNLFETNSDPIHP